MIVSSLFFGLLSMIGFPLAIVLAIMTLVRGLRIPRARRDGATCGKCGYSIDISATNGTCSECGSSLANVGVASPQLAAKFRTSALQVYGSWMLLSCVLGGFAGYAAMLISMSTSGVFTAAGPAPMTTTTSFGLTPKHDRTYVVDVEADVMFDINVGSPTGEMRVELRDLFPSEATIVPAPVLSVSVETLRWTIAAGEGGELLESGTSFDDAAVKSLYELSGREVESEVATATVSLLADDLTMRLASPLAIAGQGMPTQVIARIPDATSDVAAIEFAEGQPTVTTNGGFNPTTMMTDGWIIAAIVSGVWLLITIAGFVLIAVRRHKLFNPASASPTLASA